MRKLLLVLGAVLFLGCTADEKTAFEVKVDPNPVQRVFSEKQNRWDFIVSLVNGSETELQIDGFQSELEGVDKAYFLRTDSDQLENWSLRGKAIPAEGNYQFKDFVMVSGSVFNVGRDKRVYRARIEETGELVTAEVTIELQ